MFFLILSFRTTIVCQLPPVPVDGMEEALAYHDNNADDDIATSN
jgi:hypothetical protein